jgi:protein SCO1/2
VAAGVLLAAIVTTYGCKPAKPAPATASTINERRFPLEGRVVAADRAAHTLILDHREIPGYMKAMTMSFNVRDEWVFNAAHPGDDVRATLVVGDDAYLEDVSITELRAPADLSSTSPVHLPQKGEAVPDFDFVNQEGRAIHLAQFRGQPLLITFIYSRCPLPDYCPRMSNNFAEVAQTLRGSSPGAYARLQMLSITLDPEFDTARVLRGYGKGYAAGADPGLKHWSFATGSPDQIRRAADFFGLSYGGGNGQIVHNLRTTLLDADGKVFELYSGNRWKPADVAAQLQQLQR